MYMSTVITLATVLLGQLKCICPWEFLEGTRGRGEGALWKMHKSWAQPKVLQQSQTSQCRVDGSRCTNNHKGQKRNK